MLVFLKSVSLGNDFIVIDNNAINLKISKLCDRHFGIGADGLVIIDYSKNFVRFFNTDGSEAVLCGNAVRICAKLFRDKGLYLPIKTLAGNIPFFVRSNYIYVGLPYEMKSENIEGKYTLFNIGVPHIVIEIDDYRSIFYELKRKDYFKDYNWNFISKNGDFIEVITYERGVGFTLGCSTGASAVFLYLKHKYNINKDLKLKFPGGYAHVDLIGDRIFVGAEVKILFEGRSL